LIKGASRPARSSAARTESCRSGDDHDAYARLQRRELRVISRPSMPACRYR
jgi:hypothetical protein